MRRLLAILALMFVTCPAVARTPKPQATRLSLLQLLANPERYDGKLVSVVGFLAYGFEGDWLYLHKEDYENGIDANAVQVQRTKQMYKDLEKLDGKYVLVVGVFRNEGPKFGYASVGEIAGIQECELWSDPNHPRADRLREMQGQEQKKPR